MIQLFLCYFIVPSFDEPEIPDCIPNRFYLHVDYISIVYILCKKKKF